MWSTLGTLARVLEAVDRQEEAEALLLEGYAVAQRRAEDWRTRQAIERIIAFYENWGKPEVAAAYRVQLPEEEAPTP